jgi:tetratricopeptide (TPR) repeat protein
LGLNEIAGDWLAASGHCAEAEREYERAPTGKPAGAIQYGLGQCYQQAGDRVNALAQYRKALELDPSKEEHYLSSASLMIIVGQFDEARKILDSGIERFPESVRLVIAMGLLRLDVGYPDDARIEYEKARSLAPDSPAVWKLLGMIQRTEGDFPDAVRSFERAAALDGKDAQTYLFMGLAQERIEGGTDAALTDFQRAAQIAPGLVEAQFEAASIYLVSKGDSQRAIAVLCKIVAIAPDYAPAYRMLAQAYLRVGSLDKADRAVRKYRQLTHSGESHPPP